MFFTKSCKLLLLLLLISTFIHSKITSKIPIFLLFSINSFSFFEFIFPLINPSIHSLHIGLSIHGQENISLDSIKRLESFSCKQILHFTFSSSVEKIFTV